MPRMTATCSPIRVATLLASLLSLCSAAGCSSYVNIPAQDKDIARHNPNLDSVIDVELAALRASLVDQPIEGPFRVELPEGTAESTYTAILSKLDQDAVYDMENLPDYKLPTLDLRRVNIRGTYAWVDIIRPWDPAAPSGPRHLFTVYLQWEITTGWRADDTRIWRVPVDEALTQSMDNGNVKPGQWW